MPHDYIVKLLISFLIFFSYLILTSCDPADNSQDLQIYQYKQTRELVYLVREAAKHLSEKGTAAFQDFAQPGSKWYKDGKYIFIYDTSGTCVFHPIDKLLIGKNDKALRDINGKPIIEWIIKTAMQTRDHEGWVHYLWSDGGTICPYWKSSYVTKTVDPQGNIYILGCGLYQLQVENVFLTSLVDSAAALIERSGERAFEILKDKSSEYVYGDLYTYVFTPDGAMLVDPSFPSVRGRNILNIMDANGKYYIKEIIASLANKDKTLTMYLKSRPNETKPSRKIAYARKVWIGDKFVIVCSDKFEENEIWIKD